MDNDYFWGDSDLALFMPFEEPDELGLGGGMTTDDWFRGFQGISMRPGEVEEPFLPPESSKDQAELAEYQELINQLEAPLGNLTRDTDVLPDDSTPASFLVPFPEEPTAYDKREQLQQQQQLLSPPEETEGPQQREEKRKKTKTKKKKNKKKKPRRPSRAPSQINVFAYLASEKVPYPAYTTTIKWFNTANLIRYDDVVLHPRGLYGRFWETGVKAKNSTRGLTQEENQLLALDYKLVRLFAMNAHMNPRVRQESANKVGDRFAFGPVVKDQMTASALFDTPSRHWQGMTASKRQHCCGLLDISYFVAVSKPRGEAAVLEYVPLGQYSHDDLGNPVVQIRDATRTPPFMRAYDRYTLFAIPSSLYLEPYEVNPFAFQPYDGGADDSGFGLVDLRHVVASAIKVANALGQGGLEKIGEFRHFGARFVSAVPDGNTIHRIHTNEMTQQRKQIALVASRLSFLAKLGVARPYIGLSRIFPTGYRNFMLTMIRAANVMLARDTDSALEYWERDKRAFYHEATPDSEAFIRSMYVLRSLTRGAEARPPSQFKSVRNQTVQILLSMSFTTTPTEKEGRALRKILQLFIPPVDAPKSGLAGSVILQRPLKQLHYLVELAHLPENHPRNRDQAPFFGGMQFASVTVGHRPPSSWQPDAKLQFEFAMGSPDAVPQPQDFDKAAAILTMFGAYWEQTFDVFVGEQQLFRARDDIFGSSARYTRYMQTVRETGENPRGIRYDAEIAVPKWLVQHNRLTDIDVSERLSPVLVNPDPSRKQSPKGRRGERSKKVAKPTQAGQPVRQDSRRFINAWPDTGLSINTSDRWLTNIVTLRANPVVFDTVPLWDAAASSDRYKLLRAGQYIPTKNKLVVRGMAPSESKVAYMALQLASVHNLVYGIGGERLTGKRLGDVLEDIDYDGSADWQQQKDDSDDRNRHTLREQGARAIGSVAGALIVPYYQESTFNSRKEQSSPVRNALVAANDVMYPTKPRLGRHKQVFGVPLISGWQLSVNGDRAPAHLQIRLSRPRNEPIPALGANRETLERELTDMHFTYTQQSPTVAYLLGSRHVPDAQGSVSTHALPIESWLGEHAYPGDVRSRPSKRHRNEKKKKKKKKKKGTEGEDSSGGSSKTIKKTLSVWKGPLRNGQTHLLADVFYAACKESDYARAMRAGELKSFMDGGSGGAEVTFNPRYQLADLFVLRRAVASSTISPLPWLEAHCVATPPGPVVTGEQRSTLDFLPHGVLPEPALKDWDFNASVARFYMGLLVSGNRRLPSAMTAMACDAFALAVGLHGNDNMYAGVSLKHTGSGSTRGAVSRLTEETEALQLHNRFLDRNPTWLEGIGSLWYPFERKGGGGVGDKESSSDTMPDGTTPVNIGTANLPKHTPVQVYAHNLLAPKNSKGMSQEAIELKLAEMAEKHFFLTREQTNLVGGKPRSGYSRSAVYTLEPKSDQEGGGYAKKITAFGRALAEDLGAGMHMNRDWLARRYLGAHNALETYGFAVSLRFAQMAGARAVLSPQNTRDALETSHAAGRQYFPLPSDAQEPEKAFPAVPYPNSDPLLGARISPADKQSSQPQQSQQQQQHPWQPFQLSPSPPGPPLQSQPPLPNLGWGSPAPLQEAEGAPEENVGDRPGQFSWSTPNPFGSPVGLDLHLTPDPLLSPPPDSPNPSGLPTAQRPSEKQPAPNTPPNVTPQPLASFDLGPVFGANNLDNLLYWNSGDSDDDFPMDLL